MVGFVVFANVVFEDLQAFVVVLRNACKLSVEWDKANVM